MSTFSHSRPSPSRLAAVGVLVLATAGGVACHPPSPIAIDVTGDQTYAGVTLQIAANNAAPKVFPQVTFSTTEVLKVAVDLADSVSGTVVFAATAYDGNQCLVGSGQAQLSGVKSGMGDGQDVGLLIIQDTSSGCSPDADGGAGGGSGGMTGAGGDNGGGSGGDSGGTAGTSGSGGNNGAAGATGSCVGVTCNAPPPTSCAGSMLISYSAAGTCLNGNCSYPAATTIKCSSGCANGACNPDSCIGVTCNSPPANQCRSATQFQAYDKVGSCSAGVCGYTAQLISCTCQSSACTTDPCAGLQCTTPPAAACSNANTQVTYASKGTCNGGSCSYTSTTTACPMGCANGACNSGAGTGGRTGAGGASGTGGRTGASGTGGAAGSGTGGATGTGTGPCASFCSNPVSFTSPFNSGNLTTAARCFQTTAPFTSGNCSNFTAPRTLSVNGVVESCGSNWPALPAAVMGGYCIQVSAGNPDYAAFTTF